MEAKLIKENNYYYLKHDDKIIGTIDAHPLSSINVMKLSLKNCEEVERGYDLHELSEDWCMKPENNWSNNNNEFGDNYGSYKEGFRKALEVNSDKRFTFKEMVDCWNKALNFQEHKETLGDYMQSLQQTEWDVEIVTTTRMENGKCGLDVPIVKPKLDADGCLILKRK